MDPDSICLCGHKNNSHSDAGCQFSECSCKKWREDKSQNLDDNNKRDAKTSTRKLAERFEKMTMHKNLMRSENDQLKNTKTSTSSKISKIEKFDLDEKQREELIKLNERKEWQKINEHLEMKLKIDHENVNVWIDKGRNYVNWNKDDDAIYCFKNALMFESNQDNTFDNKKHQILFDLGEIYYNKKEEKEAIKYFEDSLKIKPDYLKSLRQLGIIYIHSDDYKKAKECLNKVLDYQSNDINALDNLGYIHQLNKEYDEAIDFFRQVRQLKDDDNTDTYAEVHEANCYYQKNDLEHAELLINKEKIKKNETQYSYKVRGDICKKLKKFNEAIENYEKEFGWFEVRDGIWFDLAYCHQLIGNYELCIEYYQKNLEYYNLGASTAQNLGDAYTALGQYENGLKWYNLGLEKFPGNENILYNKADLYIRQNKNEDAIKCYDEISKNAETFSDENTVLGDPSQRGLKQEQNLDIMRRKASCMSNMGQHHNAIKLLEEVQGIIKQNKVCKIPINQEEYGISDENLLNAIGWEFIQFGEYEIGLEFVEQALAINPKKAHIIDSKAVALKNLGRFKEAKEWFEKVFEIEKMESQKMEIGICHRKIGNELDENDKEKHNIESVKIFDSILEKNNSSAEAWYQKSLCYWNLNQYDEGKNCLLKAIKINPNKKEYWLELGEVCGVQLKSIQAIMYFDKSIKIEASSDAYHSKARTLYNIKKYDDAIDCFDKALDMYDKNKSLFPYGSKITELAKIWELKGRAYNEKENYSDAIECYDKALNLEPKYDIALMNKGNVLRILKKYSDALTCLDDAIKLDSNDYYPQHRKTLATIEMERYSDAIELAENLLEQFPEESEQTIKLFIRIYEETEDKSKQKDYEKKLQEIIDLKNNKTDGV
jgi:tetratricopeptide (TPR) repeat protein